MDQCMIDVTDIPEAAEDTRVTLVGRDGDDGSRWKSWRNGVAVSTMRIPCVLGKRVPRVYVRGGKIVGKKDYNDDRYEGFYGVKPVFEPFRKRIHKIQ